MKSALRSIPKVDAVLNEPALAGLPYETEVVKRALVDYLQHMREAIQKGEIEQSPDAAQVASDVAVSLEAIMEHGLQPVINACGVVVYTNLGRAPLAPEAVKAVIEAASGYSDLEYDLTAGVRGSRQDHIRPITRAAFGAEDALVVNNNAAATLLVLASLAQGREVIVSRGELVEIGGSFRMPEVMALSGALMKEVGTTNRTRLQDYRDAVGPQTALLMKVHRSNFALVGFTEEASLAQMSSLSRELGIPLYIDMGSGIPFDLDQAGIRDEWTIPGCLKNSDVVSFSGDKVLGGPQAGIILGRQDLIAAMARHPLHRALRVDKMTIAALGATLRLLAQGRHNAIPVLRMLGETLQAVEQRAVRLGELLEGIATEIVSTTAVVGGGSAPTHQFPSCGLALRTTQTAHLHRRLRCGDPGVVARIEEERLIFDLKTVEEDQLERLAARIREVLTDEKET